MGFNETQPKDNNKEFSFSLTLAFILGLVGLLTLVIILVALFGGIWLDRYFNTDKTFTLVLMIASIPLTIMMMFYVVRKGTAKFQNSSKTNAKITKEENISER